VGRAFVMARDGTGDTNHLFTNNAVEIKGLSIVVVVVVVVVDRRGGGGRNKSRGGA